MTWDLNTSQQSWVSFSTISAEAMGQGQRPMFFPCQSKLKAVTSKLGPQPMIVLCKGWCFSIMHLESPSAQGLWSVFSSPSRGCLDPCVRPQNVIGNRESTHVLLLLSSEFAPINGGGGGKAWHMDYLKFTVICSSGINNSLEGLVELLCCKLSRPSLLPTLHVLSMLA